MFHFNFKGSLSIAVLFAMVMLILHYIKPLVQHRPHPAGWSRSLREERRYWPMPPGDTPDDWELVGPEPYQYFHRKRRRPPTQLIEEAPGIVP